MCKREIKSDENHVKYNPSNCREVVIFPLEWSVIFIFCTEHRNRYPLIFYCDIMESTL